MGKLKFVKTPLGRIDIYDEDDFRIGVLRKSAIEEIRRRPGIQGFQIFSGERMLYGALHEEDAKAIMQELKKRGLKNLSIRRGWI